MSRGAGCHLASRNPVRRTHGPVARITRVGQTARPSAFRGTSIPRVAGLGHRGGLDAVRGADRRHCLGRFGMRAGDLRVHLAPEAQHGGCALGEGLDLKASWGVVVHGVLDSFGGCGENADRAPHTLEGLLGPGRHRSGRLEGPSPARRPLPVADGRGPRSFGKAC